MVEPRRNYRTGTENDGAPTAETRPEPVAAERPRRTQTSGDSKFINITGLFPSKSGKADTVFLTEQHCDILASLRPGDVIGVSMSQKTQKLSLWAIPNKAE